MLPLDVLKATGAGTRCLRTAGKSCKGGARGTPRSTAGVLEEGRRCNERPQRRATRKGTSQERDGRLTCLRGLAGFPLLLSCGP